MIHPLQYPKGTILFDRTKFPKPPSKEDIGKDSGWVSVYPLYLDAKRSIQDGRRVPKEKACEVVSSMHIFEACKTLGLDRAFEPRIRHPRDWLRFGRVRVRLYDKETKAPVSDDMNTRKKLFLKLCEIIPTLKIKQAPKPTSGEDGASKDDETSASAAPKTTPKSSSRRSRKKGKKKRR